MDESKSGMSWLWVLFVVVILYLIFGGGLLGGCGNRWGNWGNDCGCTRVSNCEVEKQEIIDSAQTRYLIEQQGAQTRAANAAGVAEITAQNNRIYEQGLQERIFDLKLENNSLKNNFFVKEQTDALAKQYADCCCELNRRLDGIECRMIKAPNFYGAGVFSPSCACGSGCNNF